MTDTWLRTCLPVLFGVLCALLLAACAEGAPSQDDDDDQVVAPPPGDDRAAVSSGGGKLETPRFKAEVSVGAPVSTQRVETSRYKARVGIGPWIALPPATAPAPSAPESP